MSTAPLPKPNATRIVPRSTILSIATTTSLPNIEALLEHSLAPGSIDWFDAIGAGDMVAEKKPAPDVYRYVLDKLGLPADTCLAFEDSIYSSDLSRALETARALAEREGLEIRPLPQLRERHYGCHAGVLDILYRKTTGRPLHTPRDFVIPNCSLNWFHFDEHGWRLKKWADRHHLGQVLVEVPE